MVILFIRKNKIKTKPEVNNVSIMLTENLVRYSTDAKAFDEFIQITLPYKKEQYKCRYEKIRVPAKWDKFIAGTETILGLKKEMRKKSS